MSFWLFVASLIISSIVNFVIYITKITHRCFKITIKFLVSPFFIAFFWAIKVQCSVMPVN